MVNGPGSTRFALVLFAAPRFLGELRKLYGANLSRRIRERQGDLTQLSAGSLARHPSVERIMPRSKPARDNPAYL